MSIEARTSILAGRLQALINIPLTELSYEHKGDIRY